MAKKSLRPISLDGKTFYIFDEYSSKANATMCADLARRTNLFDEVRVVPQDNRYLLCVHGVNDDRVGVTAESLIAELGLPKRIPLDEIETRSKFVVGRR